MNLEDHLGDIIAKGRFIAGVPLEKAAMVACLTIEDYTNLEKTGVAKGKPELRALATVIGLDGAKLEGIARGWKPVEPDLSLWREFRRITTSDNDLSVHCYLVWDEVTREAALFDTGFKADPIFALIDENQIQLKHLFITHTHYDHIEAMAPIRERFPKIKLHTSAKGAPPQDRNRTNDFLHLGSLRITNRDTPGHAEDGVTFIVGNFPEDAPNIVIVGDAIFAGSIGGARFNKEIARPKVREQILSLPPESLICPGHGPFTTVGQEREHNPFF